jgi:hypothetical protein
LNVGDTALVTLEVAPMSVTRYYGFIEDVLPAGLIPINTALNNEQFEKPKSGEPIPSVYYGMEVSKRGAYISIPVIDEGKGVTVKYKARIIAEGEYGVPPATFSLMYNPTVFSRSSAAHVSVVRDGKPNPIIAVKQSIHDSMQSIPWLVIIAFFILGALTLIALSLAVRFYRKKKRFQPQSDAAVHRGPFVDTESKEPNGIHHDDPKKHDYHDEM